MIDTPSNSIPNSVYRTYQTDVIFQHYVNALVSAIKENKITKDNAKYLSDIALEIIEQWEIHKK